MALYEKHRQPYSLVILHTPVRTGKQARIQRVMPFFCTFPWIFEEPFLPQPFALPPPPPNPAVPESLGDPLKCCEGLQQLRTDQMLHCGCVEAFVHGPLDPGHIVTDIHAGRTT